VKNLARHSGAALFALGAMAMIAPLFSPVWGVFAIGVALVLAGGLEFAVAWFSDERQSLVSSSVLSVLVGATLFFQSAFVFSGLMSATSLLLAVDGVLAIWRSLRGPVAGRLWGLFNGGANIGLAALMWMLRGSVGAWGFGILLGARIAASGWQAWFAPAPSDADEFANIEDQHPDRALGLPPHPIIGVVHRQALAGVVSREPADFFWSTIFAITFFAIHVGRLHAEWTWLGLLSPAVATLGDLLTSIVVALAVLRPIEAIWKRLTRVGERLVWRRMLEDVSPACDLPTSERLARWWAENRLRRLVYRDLENNTLHGAIRQTLRAGLPLTAVLIAVNPIWGFSWYFNSENWATSVWERITETRTDSWRVAMIDAVARDAGESDPTSARLFSVSPAGVLPDGDFSFLVIGDPGEGDASQHALRDQVILAARQEAVKFVVIASDVIYPSGEMKDYEPNFYLPLKGVEKPVYAIPGNHDWYNALDGFAANLMRPAAARAAMAARVESDLRLSSTTERRIEQLIADARRLRELYRVPTAEQGGPFFELHSGGFSLIAVDTGILRSVDDREMAWLRAALERSRGSFTMAILGHPFFAAGHYQAANDDRYRAVHELLRAHGVSIVMAGDTHDFEYYREPPVAGGTEPTHHFVNGGGGAYLSIGTALGFPEAPALADYAFYPRTDAMERKLAGDTPFWKWPAWWWVKRYGAWPFSVEALSGVFDFNRAPFFQSFMEVRVERSQNAVRLWLYGVDGRLRWRALQTVGATSTAGIPDGLVEFVVPMSSR
jgi:uncharacterized membrane protein HdeD (DUF308 family)